MPRASGIKKKGAMARKKSTSRPKAPVKKRKTAAKRPAIKKAKPQTKKISTRKARPQKARQVGARNIAGVDLGFEKIVAHISRGQTDEGSIEKTKFDIGVAHNAQAMAVHDIPSHYGKDHASILVVDPRFVFTYWEVRQKSMLEAAKRLGSEAKLTLRFYDITRTHAPEDAPSWDVEVFDRLGNWYLKLEYPEQILCLDVGMRSASGAFHCIARSNFLRMPPASLARPGPIKWMVVTPAGDRLISDVEEYTDADLSLLKKILGPYFFDLLMRGRFASIAGSSLEAIFYDVQALRVGESPAGRPPWIKS
ncbi:MAG: DUF4912 domain-containing protein [Pseudomonadota bacterium]